MGSITVVDNSVVYGIYWILYLHLTQKDEKKLQRDSERAEATAGKRKENKGNTKEMTEERGRTRAGRSGSESEAGMEVGVTG